MAGQGLRVWHTAAPPPAFAAPQWERLLGWAAVGAVPAAAAPAAARRLELGDVPLGDLPPWLGIDRALVGWAGWRRQGGAVLVADAGTVLSLTRVDGEGRFAGGRLLAGVALQLRAMAAGTRLLPRLDAAQEPSADPPHPWPKETAAAMRAGVLRGLAAAISASAEEAGPPGASCSLLLTGGDGAALEPLVAQCLAEPRTRRGERAVGPAPLLQLVPGLALEALAALRPEPGPGPEPKPLSPAPGR